MLAGAAGGFVRTYGCRCGRSCCQCSISLYPPAALSLWLVPVWLGLGAARARLAAAQARSPRDARRGDLYDCNVKFTVTVMMTGTGTLFNNVGVYSH